MDKQTFLETYKTFTKNWPIDRLDDLQEFLTCEYTDFHLSKMFRSFHKTKSIKIRLQIVDMFKDYLTKPSKLDIICKKLGVE